MSDYGVAGNISGLHPEVVGSYPTGRSNFSLPIRPDLGYSAF